jgi:hypothetical protein
MKNKKTFWSLLVSITVLFVGGWAAVFWLFNPDVSGSWLLPIVFFFLAVVFLGIFSLVENDRKRANLAILLFIFPSLFLGRSRWYFMIPVILFSHSLIFIALQKIKMEKENRLRIKPQKLVKYGLAYITTSLSLLVAAGYFFSSLGSPVSLPQFNLSVPDGIISKSLEISQSVYPNSDLKLINSGATVDDFIKISFENSAENDEHYNTVKSQGDFLDGKNEEAVVLNKAVEKSRQTLSKQLQTDLSGNEKMKDVLAGYINRRIKEIFLGSDGGGSFLPLGLALGLFLTLKTIAWLLTYPAVWTIGLVFRIMLWNKALEIVKVQKEAEEIE